jgi:hypothetical protein
MDFKKVEAITKWGAPENLQDVRAFLDFANVYCRFIKGCSNIVAPIVALNQKDHKFFSSHEYKKAFQFLKEYFTFAPVLSHFDPDKEIIVEIDGSDFVSTGTLSQYNG